VEKRESTCESGIVLLQSRTGVKGVSKKAGKLVIHVARKWEPNQRVENPVPDHSNESVTPTKPYLFTALLCLHNSN